MWIIVNYDEKRKQWIKWADSPDFKGALKLCQFFADGVAPEKLCSFYIVYVGGIWQNLKEFCAENGVQTRSRLIDRLGDDGSGSWAADDSQFREHAKPVSMSRLYYSLGDDSTQD